MNDLKFFSFCLSSAAIGRDHRGKTEGGERYDFGGHLHDAHWNESSGEIGQNLETLEAYIFENMKQKSSRVVLMAFS